MSFAVAVRTCFTEYVFTGRAARPEYLWFALSYVIATFVALFFDPAVGTTAVLRFPWLARLDSNQD